MKARFIIILIAIVALLAGCSHYLNTKRLKFESSPDITGNYKGEHGRGSSNLVINNDYYFIEKGSYCKGQYEYYGRVKLYGNHVAFFKDSTVYYSLVVNDSIYYSTPTINKNVANDSSVFLFYDNQLFVPWGKKYSKYPQYRKI